MAKQSVTDFVVRNGASVDLDKTLEKFGAALQDFLAHEELTNGRVAQFVHAVLDKFPGCKFNQKSIVSFTLKEMDCAPDQYSVMSEAVLAYINANKGTRESGAIFMVQRGKGVNFARWSDLPEEK